MRGRDYAGATVYYTVNYSPKDKLLNENCRIIVRESAVTYLKTTGDNTAAKVKYLRSLTHDTRRYGANHKYQGNLNAEDISYIIRSVHDDDLYLAYFGMVTETPNDRKKALISASVIILFFFLFTILIASLNN